MTPTTTESIGWKQKLREQPVIVARIVGLIVSLIATEFALPVSEGMKELIRIVIICYVLGPGAVETAYQWIKVIPVAKQERLDKEEE